jgi:hypothetical protein
MPDTSEKILWFKKGVYLINNITPSRNNTEKRVSIDLWDKFSLLEGKAGVITESINIPMNSLVADVIEDILLADMGNGRPFDTKTAILHSSFKNTRLPMDITE